MKKHGLTLLELVIGLVISAMITGVLMNLFSSSLKSLRRVTEVAEKDQNSTVLLYQLTKDLQGVFIVTPTVAKAFEVIEKNKKFEQLTFLTTNPRTRFVSPLPEALPKPQLVRVTYNLRGNALYRSETTELVLDPKKKQESLLVIDGLSTFSLSFKYTLTTEKQPEVKTELSWSSDRAFEKESKLPPLPQMVVLTLAKGDYYIEIPCYKQPEVAQPAEAVGQLRGQSPGGVGGYPIPKIKIGFKTRPTFLDKYFGKPA